jgi:predicted MFS family arabinose efflux permease
MVESAVRSTPALQGAITPSYRSYALRLLALIYGLNQIDRQVINILAEPIKRDLGLADWQIGLMSGLAFALFYTVLGIPIARAAEHRNRPLIIAGSLAAWSGFTALSGMAGSFLQLCLFRVGVGVGEAGCTPAAQALISDYYPKARRASALAVYALGVPIGAVVGLAFGGIVADAFGWRQAFLLVGAPGLVVAALAALTLRETRARVSADLSRTPQASVAEAFRTLASKRTFWLLATAVGFKVMFTDGQAPFIASFFLRNHGPQIAELAAHFGLKPIGFIGLAIGLMTGVLGALSTWLGGVIADAAAARDVRNVVVTPAVAIVITVPAYIAALTVSDARVALGLLMVMCFTNSLWAGPVYATTHAIVPRQLRATATSVLILVINLMGMASGPVIWGALSDLFSGPLGLGPASGLRAALIGSALASLAGAGLYWRARSTILADLEPDD